MANGTERRNDVGNKILVAVISSLVSLIMLASVFSAERANSNANNNTKDIAVIQTEQKYQTALMTEVKDDVKELKHVIVGR